MEYKNQSLTKYLDDLSAKIPAPGGGSAAAMNAALGISLVNMLLNYTIGKEKYSKYEIELKKILKESVQLRSDFLRFVDLDVTAYKSGDARKALDVPLMLARLVFEAIKICPGIINKSNVNLISDLACGVALLESAFSAACFNVDINLEIIKDKKLASVIRKELRVKEKLVKRIRAKTEERVGKIIRG